MANEILVSVVIPAYNAVAYLDRAMASVLGFGPAVEVIIVDDGSTDDTAQLAQGYVARFPETVRLVRQANAGHGGAVNTGIAHARGRYLRVLDADDWLDRDALAAVLEVLGALVASGAGVDVLVTNYVYEKVGKRTKKVVRYRGPLKPGRVLGWPEVGHFRKAQYLNMHALTYRTEVLRESGLRLPEHTFYVDNLYAAIPLACVRRLFYLDVDLYRYFIGRDDQSINEPVMIRRIDQQLLVTHTLLDYIAGAAIPERRLRRYLLHYAEIICAVTSIILIRAGTSEALAVRDRMWADFQARDPELYRQIRRSPLGRAVNVHSRMGRGLVVLVYLAARRVVGFN